MYNFIYYLNDKVHVVVQFCRQLSMGIPGRPHPLIWVCNTVILSNELKTCICDSILGVQGA